MFEKNKQNLNILTVAVIIALVIGVVFLRQFFAVIVSAIIVAFLFSPVYEWLKSKTRRTGASAALTLLITLLAIIIPIILIGLITVNQARQMIEDLTSLLANQTFAYDPNSILNRVNELLSNLSGREVLITQEQVVERLSSFLTSALSTIVSVITGWISGIGGIITSVILYMYIFTAVLVYQDKLIAVLQQLNPLGEKITNLYLNKTAAMTKGMVRGQFIIAIIQGVASALILGITGMPYVAFFALLLSFMSIIPLGAGIITIPIGIVRILLGDIWQGVLIVLGHVLVITNIDNVLKPILVPKSVKLQSALTMLAVFAGLRTFGLLGIVIGPVIMILIITTLDIYLQATKSVKEK
jgi:predicted PurR-regulated permease PerM